MALSDSEHLEVEQVVKRLLGGLRMSVAAQQDGTDASDGRRVMNFQGEGVVVTDEPLMRPVNVNIPGVRFSNVALAINSDTTTKRLSLWNGTSNNSPPASWQTTGFNDSAWTASTIATQGSGQSVFVPTGASTIWSSSTPSVTATPGEKVLFRRTFTLSGAAILSATLTAAWDAWGDIYINGTLLGSDTEMVHAGPQVIVNVSPSLFNLGGSNVIAVLGNDDGGGGSNKAWVTFQLAYYTSASTESYVLVQDRKAQNTDGGTFTSGADRTRTLNTIVSDVTGIASVASNQVTLPLGDYRCHIICPGHEVDRHQAWLYNVTDSIELARGTSVASGAADATGQYSLIVGRFTLSGSKALEVRHRCSTTGTTSGFGRAANFGTEIYTSAEFWKLG